MSSKSQQQLIVENKDINSIHEKQIILRQVIEETKKIIEHAEMNFNGESSNLEEIYKFAEIVESKVRNLRETIQQQNLLETIDSNSTFNNNHNINKSITSPNIEFDKIDFDEYYYQDDEDEEDDSDYKEEQEGASFSSSSGSESEEIPIKKPRGRPPIQKPFRCMRCYKSETPEWRKAKDQDGKVIDVCNACGLAYLKKKKKEKESIKKHSISTILN